MAATPSLKIVKTFPYRGSIRTFSSRYHFNGGLPADGAHWTTFADAVVAAEKAIYSSASGACSITSAVGYAAGSDVPIFSKPYSVAGTGGSLGGTMGPGDAAALVRWATTARSSKNHPIYLFSFFHCPRITISETIPDTLTAAYVTALQTYANAWMSGFSDGTNTYVRAGPNGATATGAFVEAQVTHRDLPR
jgi:hypothetical protein